MGEKDYLANAIDAVKELIIHKLSNDKFCDANTAADSLRRLVDIKNRNLVPNSPQPYLGGVASNACVSESAKY